MTTSPTLRTRAFLGASLVALSLAACSKPVSTGVAAGTPPASALPLAGSGVEPPLAPSVLPPAAPVPTAFNRSPRDRYRWVDEAQAFNSALADSPPDYTVNYQGTRPWVWRARNGARRVTEHTPDGDRTYYYAPGAQQPYLVRSPQYAYAYDQGQLAAVYDDQGRPIADAEAQARAERAGEYLARARDLYAASENEQHQAAALADWRARRDAQIAQERAWQVQQQRDADWRAWHDQNAAAQARAYDQERANRTAYVASLGAVAVGAFVAGRDSAPRHDDGGRRDQGYDQGRGFGFPQDGNRQQYQADTYRGGGDPGRRDNPQADQGFARRQQAQADQARFAQQNADQAAVMRARQQQAQADAARQAAMAGQQNAIVAARRQQMQADAARQAQDAQQAQARGLAAQQQAQAEAGRRAQAQAAEAQARAQAGQAQAARDRSARDQAQASQAAAQAQRAQAQAARAQAASAQARQQQQANDAARQTQAEQARAGAEVARHQAEIVAHAQQQAQAEMAKAQAARAQEAKAAAKPAVQPTPPAAEPKKTGFHGSPGAKDPNVAQP